MVETFAALAEPNRFRIVELLRSGATAVNDIGSTLKLNQPQVSKHLKVLREAGLVDVQARAQQRLYELKPEPLQAMDAWLQKYRELWDARFEAMDDVLEALKKGRAKR